MKYAYILLLAVFIHAPTHTAAHTRTRTHTLTPQIKKRAHPIAATQKNKSAVATRTPQLNIPTANHPKAPVCTHTCTPTPQKISQHDIEEEIKAIEKQVDENAFAIATLVFQTAQEGIDKGIPGAHELKKQAEKMLADIGQCP